MAKLKYGSFYFSTPAATVLAAATPLKAAGTTTELTSYEFTHTDNRLTYNGVIARDFFVHAELSITKEIATESLLTLHIAKNGVPVTGLNKQFSVGPVILDSGGTPHEIAGTQRPPVSVSGALSLSGGDYVEVWVETDTGDDITVQDGTVYTKVLG
jgi:hypothetical protein